MFSLFKLCFGNKPHDLRSKVYFILGFNTTLDKVHHVYNIVDRQSLDKSLIEARTMLNETH